MLRAPRIRILIASGARARFVERRLDHPDPVTLEELTPHPHHGAGHGPASASFEHAAGPGRGSGGDRGDSARRLRAFAVQIAEVVNAQFKKGDFERLGLVCPPRLMREIREHLTDGARGAIHFEVPKDLTKYGNHQLREWLPNPQFV